MSNGRVTGSREPSPDGLGPSGFDPARMAAARGWKRDADGWWVSPLGYVRMKI